MRAMVEYDNMYCVPRQDTQPIVLVHAQRLVAAYANHIRTFRLVFSVQSTTASCSACKNEIIDACI